MASLRMPWIVLATIATVPAAAADLYRCVSPAGAVSFQDAPCAAGSQLSRTIPVLVDPVKPETERRTGSKAKASAAKPGGAKAKGDSRSRQRTVCEKARKQRDAALDRLGLDRTFEKLRALDAEVQEACKGL